MSNYYNTETLLEQQAEIEKLKSERDALAAQVEALREVISERFTRKELQPDGTIITDGAPWALQLLAATPQQHLAEIRAEAVKNEFGSILHSVANQFTGDDTANPWHNGANHVFVLFAKEIDKRVKSIGQGEVK